MIILPDEQGSYEWHKNRAGIVTGTGLKSALGSKTVQQTYRCQLVAERMTEVQITEIGSGPVARGKEMEPLAIAATNKAIFDDSSSDQFMPIGMLAGEIDGFALSPDGVLQNFTGDIFGGCEIKCPNSATHVRYCLDGGVPKEYWHQVLAPYVLSDEIECWYFVSYDDRNYDKPLYVFKTDRDYFGGQKAIRQYREQLISFIDSVNQAHISLTF